MQLASVPKLLTCSERRPKNVSSVPVGLVKMSATRCTTVNASARVVHIAR